MLKSPNSFDPPSDHCAGPISKWQTLGTRTKLSFRSSSMANQTYPQDGLMCGLKLFLGDHTQRNRRLKFFPNFWEIFF